jgi:uncharacterized protein YbjT (DUF2867 family)
VRVLLIGATGLVGRSVLERLADREDIRLDLLLRRAVAGLSSRVRCVVADGLPAALARWQAEGGRCDVLVSAFGTTRNIAGSVEAFARIDRDLVVEVARAARASGARQALLVSSVGAGARSRNDYLRIKGELENAVAALGFERCDFLQPGLLLGAREGFRPAERLGQRLAPLVNPLLLGPLKRYRAIEAARVAQAVVALLGRREAGTYRHDFRALSDLSALPAKPS